MGSASGVREVRQGHISKPPVGGVARKVIRCGRRDRQEKGRGELCVKAPRLPSRVWYACDAICQSNRALALEESARPAMKNIVVVAACCRAARPSLRHATRGQRARRQLSLLLRHDVHECVHLYVLVFFGELAPLDLLSDDAEALLVSEEFAVHLDERVGELGDGYFHLSHEE